MGGDLIAVVPDSATRGPITIATPDGSFNSCENFAVLTPEELFVSQIASPEWVTTGDDLFFTILVTNRGPENLSGVVLQCELSDGRKVNAVTSTQGECVFTNSSARCNVGPLNVGSVATVLLGVDTTLPGKTTCVSTFAADNFSPESQVHFAASAAVVLAPTELLVRALPEKGLEISWSIQATNLMLQVSENIASGPWEAVSSSPVESQRRNILVLTNAVAGNRFYRLIHP